MDIIKRLNRILAVCLTIALLAYIPATGVFSCCCPGMVNAYAALTDEQTGEQTGQQAGEQTEQQENGQAGTQNGEQAGAQSSEQTENSTAAQAENTDTEDVSTQEYVESEPSENEEELTKEQEEAQHQKAESIQTNEIPRWPIGPAVSAEGAILIDADTGTVLYGKNIHERLYPASTTKILTTLIASERCSLDEVVKFSKKAVNSIERSSSNMGIDIGQELTMEQCLYGILVYSANEVANAVAEHVSGSIEDFVDLMNQRAVELGCTDSHFVTTNGLHDDAHYTTPYDLAMIGKAFFANETLAKISGTNYYHIAPSKKQPDDIELYTHNQLTRGKYKYDGYVGGKTGYTTIARQTLVTCAERGNMRLICVVMRDESPDQYKDTMSLFDYGFENFKKVNVAENETRYTIRDSEFFESESFKSNQSLMVVDPADSIIMPITLSFDELDAFMNTVDDPEQPQKIASIEYTYEGIPLGSGGIILSDTPSSFDFYHPTGTEADPEKVVFVDVKKVVTIFAMVFGVLLLLTIVAGIIRSFHFSRKNNGQNLNFRKKERRRGIPLWQQRQYRKRSKRQQELVAYRMRQQRKKQLSFETKNHHKGNFK